MLCSTVLLSFIGRYPGVGRVSVADDAPHNFYSNNVSQHHVVLHCSFTIYRSLSGGRSGFGRSPCIPQILPKVLFKLHVVLHCNFFHISVIMQRSVGDWSLTMHIKIFAHKLFSWFTLCSTVLCPRALSLL